MYMYVFVRAFQCIYILFWADLVQVAVRVFV